MVHHFYQKELTKMWLYWFLTILANKHQLYQQFGSNQHFDDLSLLFSENLLVLMLFQKDQNLTPEIRHKIKVSTISRQFFIPFQCYDHSKNVPQKVLPTIFPCIYHMKTKQNIVFIWLKIKIFFIDTNMRPLAPNIGGLGVSLNYPLANFKNMVHPKNS